MTKQLRASVLGSLVCAVLVTAALILSSGGRSKSSGVQAPAGAVVSGTLGVLGGLNPPTEWPIGSCDGLSGSGTSFDKHAHLFYLTVTNKQRLNIVVACEAI